MNSATPEASFDVLYVIRDMTQQHQRVTSQEVQLFCYLACLLALYHGDPVADWGYEFTSTPTATPFSVDCSNAVSLLLRRRLASSEEGLLSITSDGEVELSNWEQLSLLRSRTRFLRGSTGAATALPVPAVGSGLAMEPQIFRATQLRDSRLLLDNVGLGAVYEQFAALEEALGTEVRDFMVPAVVWLSFLLEQDSARGELGIGEDVG